MGVGGSLQSRRRYHRDERVLGYHGCETLLLAKESARKSSHCRYLHFSDNPTCTGMRPGILVISGLVGGIHLFFFEALNGLVTRKNEQWDLNEGKNDRERLIDHTTAPASSSRIVQLRSFGSVTRLGNVTGRIDRLV